MDAHSDISVVSSRKVHIMYKVVYRDKRVAILKDVSQLLRFLSPVDSMKYTFKVYKSRKVNKMVQQEIILSNTYYCWDRDTGHTGGWFCEHRDCKAIPEQGCSDWGDWSRALHESGEIGNLNTFYSGIEA